MPAEEDEFYISEPVLQKSNEIWYTTTDGAIVTPKADDDVFGYVFGAKMVSNTYNNGKGVMTFEGDVTVVGQNAFTSCDNLSTIIIPEKVTAIKYAAFYDCENLTSVTFSDGITDINIEYRIFQECPKLSAFYGSLASSDNRCVVVNGVVEGFASAGLTEYAIPNGVTAIGYGAFDGCRNLKSVTIPDSVTTLVDDAFYKCSTLASVALGKGVATIGDNAFAYCYALPSITIPESVTEIKSGAFAYCESLSEVICESTTPPTIGHTIFYETNSGLVIYVPASADDSIVNAYKSATNWSGYQDRIKEDNKPFGIGDMKGETEEDELEY